MIGLVIQWLLEGFSLWASSGRLVGGSRQGIVVLLAGEEGWDVGRSLTLLAADAESGALLFKLLLVLQTPSVFS